MAVDRLEDRVVLAGIVAVGNAWGIPEVRIFDAETQELLRTLRPFEGPMPGGVRVAVGDVTGDRVPDVAVGAGAGRGRVRVYDGTTWEVISGLDGLAPFGERYHGGVHVALGDVNRDGKADLITGTDGVGRFAAMRWVRVFDVASGAVLAQFRPDAPDPAHRAAAKGGVRVAARDLTGDARADIITAVGRGRIQAISARSVLGPHVGVLGRTTATLAEHGSQVYVGATDRDRDAKAEILVSVPGEVRVYGLPATAGGALELRETLGQPTGWRSPIGTVEVNRDGVSDLILGLRAGGVILADGRTGGELARFQGRGTHLTRGLFVAGSDRRPFGADAPPPPPGEGSASVLSRLGLYDATSQSFSSLTTAFTADQVEGKNLYVIAHGWAPDWRDAVDQYALDHPGDFLKWWQTTTKLNDQWPGDYPASAFLFEGFSKDLLLETVVVSPAGLAAAISQLDSNAVVLAYSWIDESATDSATVAYPSEARTYQNGLRMAEAVELALGPLLTGPSAPALHMMGHSHGSKVATVATARLRLAGAAVPQLTVFDSPESTGTEELDAQNLLWFFLPGVNPGTGSGQTFVDNYVSEFGIDYATFPNLSQVRDVDLSPDVLLLGPGDAHDYSVFWYAGASLDTSYGGNQYGLGWSPLLHPGVPAALGSGFAQGWDFPVPSEQFELTETRVSPPAAPTKTPVFTAAALSDITTQGSAGYSMGVVSLTGSSARGSASSLTGTLDFEQGSVGISFTLQFTGAAAGDVLTIAVGGVLDTSYQYFTLDGGIAGPGIHQATLSVYSNEGGTYPMTFTLLSGGSSTAPSVQVSNLRQITISDS
jgi:hypothetical protein